MIVQPETLAVFALAALAILAVPGPAVVYIVTRSIHQGRAAGLASVVGIHVGTLVHLTFAVVGLSAILVSSATAFTVVKVLGAVYLIVIGKTTVGGLQSGVVYGFAGQVDGIVTAIRGELGVEATVVATGGLSALVAPHSRTISVVDPNLTLDGLRIVWDLNA